MKTEQPEPAGFAVQPKMDCPHLTEQKAESINNYLHGIGITSDLQCKVCEDKKENWVCLTCLEVFCSRYVKEHMVAHNCETSHEIALSFSDGSYWCYSCESYIDSPWLRPARKSLSQIKTNEEKQLREAK